MSIQYPHVVVLLGTSECPQDPNTRCVMEVHGPYEYDQKEEAMSRWPEWTTPHWMRLQDVER